MAPPHGALVVGGLSFLWWWLLVRPIGFATDLEAVVTVAYAIFCLAVVGMVVATRVLPSRHGTLSMHLVAVGVAASVLTNGLYVHTSITGAYISGDWIQLGWELQGILFGLAAFVAVRDADRPANWMRFRESRDLGTGLVVLAAVAVAIGLLVADGLRGTLTVATGAGAAALAALVVARLWFLLERADSSTLTDAKTGTYNQDYFRDQLARLVGRGRHFGGSFALALAEVDAYEDVDDEAVDAQVARRLVRGAREVDLVARLGPGRFAVLIPNVDPDAAFAVSEDSPRGGHAAAPDARGKLGAHRERRRRDVDARRRHDDVLEEGERGPRSRAAARANPGSNRPRRPGFLRRRRPRRRALRGDRRARATRRRTRGDLEHSGTVAVISSAIALEMGLDPETVSRTYVAGLLHDLGKLALSEAMLEKPGPLDPDEWDDMFGHAEAGASLVARIAAVRDAAPIIAAHHERWDGAGYPLRLDGERIPAEARIVAVADALVAMTSDPPYRSAQTGTSALTAIWRDSGRRYDPAVVSALLALARDGRLVLPHAVDRSESRERADALPEPANASTGAAEAAARFALVPEPRIDDIDALVGPATPHFAYQIRARVRALVRELPEDHPIRRYGEEKIELLERLAHASSKAEEGPLEPPERLGWEGLPSHGVAVPREG